MANLILRTLKCFAVLLLCLGQAACLGVETPQIQEFWGAPGDADAKVRLLVLQVRCELARAIYRERHLKDGSVDHRLDFLDKWGVQVILVLSVDEKSSFAPGLSVISPLPTAVTSFASGPVTSAQSFAGNIGGVYSNEAIAVDRTTLFYLVRELDVLGAEDRSCMAPAPNATLFVQSELGIYDWLRRNLNIHQFDNANLRQGNIDNVLSHDVKFEIVSSGNATPTWKLVRFTGNTTSPLFLASRDRYQELIITMGKAKKVGGGLSDAASASSLASQISSAIQSNTNRQ